MFQNTNRITFHRTPTAEDQRWWLSDVYEPSGLTPEDVGDLLTASWPGDKIMEVNELDGARKRFGISVLGEFGAGQFWIVERSFDLKGAFLNADRMFIDPNHHHQGLGRRFMADTVDFARRIGLTHVRLEADDVGRYAWLRCGFLPSRGTWLGMKSDVIRRIVQAREHLSQARFEALLTIAEADNPEAARELAAQRDPVQSRELLDFQARRYDIPIGRAIFIESAPPWPGQLDLADHTSMTLLADYVRNAG